MQTNRLIRHRILHTFEMSSEFGASNFVAEFTLFHKIFKYRLQHKKIEMYMPNVKVRMQLHLCTLHIINYNKQITSTTLPSVFTSLDSQRCSQIDSPKDIELPESGSGATVCFNCIYMILHVVGSHAPVE